jgi:hypothetical protein
MMNKRLLLAIIAILLAMMLVMQTVALVFGQQPSQGQGQQDNRQQQQQQEGQGQQPSTPIGTIPNQQPMLSPSGQQQYFYLWIPSVLKACHQNYQGLIVTTVMQPFKQQVYLSADNDAIIFTDTERELQLQEFKNHLPFTFSTKCNINDTDVTVKVSVSGHIQEKKVKVKTDRPNVEDDTITEILLPDTIGTDEITGFIVSNKPIDGSSSSNSSSSSSSSSSKKVSVVSKQSFSNCQGSRTYIREQGSSIPITHQQ